MKHLGIIGCGLRSDCYLSQMRDGLGSEWAVRALADPNETARRVYQRNYGNHRAREFETGPELIAALGGELDGLIIGSPNSLHLESVVPAVRLGIPILLEKPVATTVEDCQRMEEAYREAGSPPLAVGFVLRYTVFYRKALEIVRSGLLGEISTIQATEYMGMPLSALYMRNWRRHSRLAGPLILEKCSHDMDVLNCLAGSSPSLVFSQGGLRHFVPKKAAALHCKDCAIRNDCRYDVETVGPYLMDVSRRDEIAELIPSDNDLCVYNSDKDILDHQTCLIRYQNGIQASFTVASDQPRTTRTLRITGSGGELAGDIGRDELRLVRFDKQKGGEQVETFSLEHDDSGHHGGDSAIAEQFKAMLRGLPAPPLAGLREGIDAALLALAAQQSYQQDQPVKPTLSTIR